MKPEDAEEYTQALGQVVAGGYRQIALGERLGVAEALGLSTREWVEERIGGYVRYTLAERHHAVAELEAEGFTDNEIADIIGVSERTVQRDLADLRAPDDAEDHDEPAAGDDLRAPDDAEDHAVSGNDGDEWYTPRWLFDALGIKFSIDVCAPLDLTHVSVPAERHFTIEDDGLAQGWDGTVWVNPPYSKPEPWARRLIHHRDGLLLTHMPMNAGWCVDTWEACDGIRLFQAMEFVRPDGSIQRPGYWLQLAAFGPVATEGLARLQPLGDAAVNKRRIASPMWRRAA